ncbi:6-carboxytetrahydropterin synthase [uncultured Methanobrevibacter sp.]|uniref:6-carboxytetrahydropterin synthase n=1 Tax=uncultured Methanobrevibacter sp. TaxID=253161 RepID=UPI0025E69DCC|nr:6-carboxytetrahydropterin synthase [uncultured Methanobrevibacter sp.]
MKILINGINANLRFSAAHLIPTHETCGCIHGHSYFVDIEIEGEKEGKFDFVVDFKDIKPIVNELCNSLDHKFLIPIFNDNMDFKDLDKKNLSMESFDKFGSVQFKIDSKGYTIPKEDCVLLPLKYTSAESLSEYFVQKLSDALKDKTNIKSISACVNEGIGQGAMFTKEL